MKKKLIASAIIGATCLFTAYAADTANSESSSSAASKEKPIIIAHRGASGYVPEHTLIAKAVAYAQDPDYIEQDVSMTKDKKIVVMHDILLDTNTNVKELYPDRAEADHNYHISDFTLGEIKKLSVHERTGNEDGTPVFGNRFPETDALELRVPTLEQDIILIQGMNKSTGKDKGIYVELKKPWTYPDHGKEFAKIVLSILDKYGYNSADSKCFIQCFDPYLLKYMKDELNTKLRLIQLIGKNEWNETPGVDYDKMLTKEGLKEVSKYAYGIGPDISQLFTNYENSPDLQLNNVSKWAHEFGLKIHPYTLRNDALPKGLTYNQVCDILFKKAKVDGMFTDFPDMGAQYIKNNF